MERAARICIGEARLHLLTYFSARVGLYLPLHCNFSARGKDAPAWTAAYEKQDARCVVRCEPGVEVADLRSGTGNNASRPATPKNGSGTRPEAPHHHHHHYHTTEGSRRRGAGLGGLHTQAPLSSHNSEETIILRQKRGGFLPRDALCSLSLTHTRHPPPWWWSPQAWASCLPAPPLVGHHHLRAPPRRRSANRSRSAPAPRNGACRPSGP